MSDLTTAFSYDVEGEPVMLIYKKQPVITTFRLEKPAIEAYVIPLSDAYMFSSEHYPMVVRVFYGIDAFGRPVHGEKVLNFDEAMMAKCNELCLQFDLGLVTTQKMGEIAGLIEDGLEELLKMPPQDEKDRPEDIDSIVEEMKLKQSDN